MTPEELAAHEARHQALREAWAEVARLRDWKAEALTVLADWEGCDAEWDWKAGRSLHAALRAAVDGEA